MRKLALPFAALAAAVVVAAPATGAAKTVTLTAKLSGAKEVPGPGDSDGKGKAVIRLNAAKGKVCYVITANRIDGAAAGHIHEGDAATAGNVVVSLFGTASDKKTLKGCATGVDSSVIANIVSDPKNHYVNIHNEAFPGGAIRGQLRKGKN